MVEEDKPPASEEAGSPRERPQRAEVGGDGSPDEEVQLLLVGDPELTSAVKGAEEALIGLGYEVSTALHVEEALGMLDTTCGELGGKPIAGILASVTQPEGHMDGAALVAELQGKVSAPPVFVLIEESTNSEAREEFLATGARAVLVPPFSEETIRRHVLSVIERTFWKDKALALASSLEVQKHEFSAERARHDTLIERMKQERLSDIGRLKVKIRGLKQDAERDAKRGATKKDTLKKEIAGLKGDKATLEDLVLQLKRKILQVEREHGEESEVRSAKADAESTSLQKQIKELESQLASLQKQHERALDGSRKQNSEAAEMEAQLRAQLAKRDNAFKNLLRKYNSALLKSATSEVKETARMDPRAAIEKSEAEALETRLQSPLQQMTTVVSGLAAAEKKGVPLKQATMYRAVHKLGAILRQAAEKDLNMPDVKAMAESLAPGDRETARYLKSELFRSELSLLDGAKELDQDLRRERYQDGDSGSADDSRDFARAMAHDSLRFVGDRAALEKAACALFEDPQLRMREYLRVPASVIKSWVHTVAENYQDIPYHNFAHAVDVAHTTFAYLTNTRAGIWLPTLDKISLVVAALSLDVGHPGLNNAFQASTQSVMARTYNDVSVLESFHAAMTFEIMSLPADVDPAKASKEVAGILVRRPDLSADTNIFQKISAAQLYSARKFIINAILHTDMAKHFEILSKLETHLATCGGNPGDELFDVMSPENRLLLGASLLHASDISNPAKPANIARAWAGRAQEEFLAQGDREKEKGLQVSAFCDRDNVDTARLNLNFIDFIVAPFFKVLASAMPEFSVHLSELEANRGAWADEFFGTTDEAKRTAIRDAAVNRQGRVTGRPRSRSFEDGHVQPVTSASGSDTFEPASPSGLELPKVSSSQLVAKSPSPLLGRVRSMSHGRSGSYDFVKPVGGLRLVTEQRQAQKSNSLQDLSRPRLQGSHSEVLSRRKPGARGALSEDAKLKKIGNLEKQIFK